MKGLNLHSGGELIELADLERVPVPEATATHHPLPHIELVRMAKFALQFYGHEVVEELHAIDKDGARYFGLLTLKSEYGDWTDTVGLRNSSDKSFPIGISMGAAVFVCSNLSFLGDHVIRRKHTAKARFDLPGLVAGVVEPLRDQRVHQARVFEAFKATRLSAAQVDHAILQMYRAGVISVTKIADVLDAYTKPQFEWGGETLWQLFNATTFVLTGKVSEDPSLTNRLHNIIEGFCEVVDDRQLALLEAAE